MDNKNGSKEEFDQLRKSVFKMAMLQRSWGMTRPIRWLKLEVKIHYEAQKQSSKYLQLPEGERLALECGVSKEEVKIFLQFHHSMGDLVHYQEENLQNLVINDPQWLIDMFKALITHDHFLEKRSMNNLALLRYKQKAVLSTQGWIQGGPGPPDHQK